MLSQNDLDIKLVTTSMLKNYDGFREYNKVTTETDNNS
jgi:hypothetical protein